MSPPALFVDLASLLFMKSTAFTKISSWNKIASNPPTKGKPQLIQMYLIELAPREPQSHTIYVPSATAGLMNPPDTDADIFLETKYAAEIMREKIAGSLENFIVGSVETRNIIM